MRRLGVLLGFCVAIGVGSAQQSDIVWRQPLLSGRAIAVSPNGQWLAVAAEGGQIAVYRVSDRQMVGVLRGHLGETQALAFSPDSQKLASIDDAGQLYLWSLNSGSRLWSISAHAGSGLAVAYAPNGNAIATGGTDNKVALWNPTNGAPISVLSGHSTGVSAVAFSMDGALLASGDWAGNLRIWNLADGSLIHSEPNAHLDAINALAWSPNGQWLATGSSNRDIRLWGVGTWLLERTLSGHDDAIYGVMFSADGSFLFSASADHTVRQWNPNDGSAVRTFSGHTGEVRGLAGVSPTQIVSCGADRTVRFWEVATGNTSAVIGGHSGVPRTVAFVSGGYALSGDDRGVLHLWGVSNGAPGPRLSPHPQPILAVAASPDGTRIAIGDPTGTVTIRAMPSGATLTQWSAHNEEILALAFSPDGQQLATASFDGTVKLWQMPAGTLVRTFGGHTGTANAVAFSPDGTQLATGDASGTIRLWSPDGTLQATIPAHTDPITGLSYRPTGSHLASSSTDGTVRIWDLATLSAVRTLMGNGSAMLAIGYTPNGEQVVASEQNGIVRVWGADTGDLARQINAHAGEARALSVSPDGTYIFSAGTDGLVMIYTAGPPNHPPFVPTLISPSEGQAVSRAPTFELQVSDPDGDQVRAVLEIVDAQNQSRTLQTNWVSGGTVSVSVPANQPLLPGAYRWRARAEDARGATSAESQWRNFTVTNSPPAKPVILAPADNAQLSATPTFRLHLSDPDRDRVRARIEVMQGTNTVRTFETELVSNNQEVAFQVPENDALEPGTYQWHARAEDVHGAQSDWTSNRTFTVPSQNRPPDLPLRLSPSNGATVGAAPTFRLRLTDPDTQPVRAEIEIVSSQGVTRTYQTDEVASGQEVVFTVPSDAPLSVGVYQWRARTRDSVGEWSAWTDQWRFEVVLDNRPPEVPVLVEPAEGVVLSTPTPTFRLRLTDPDSEQVSAIIRITRSDNVSVELRTSTVASGQTVSLTVSEPLASGDYLWEARAVDARGAQSDWSPPRAFTLNCAPSVPTLLSPAPNTFTSRTPILRLRADDPENEPIRYEIELTDGTRTWRHTTDEIPSGTVLPFPIPENDPLSAGQITWRARVQDLHNNASEWSPSQTFHAMDEITPELIGITDFALNLNLQNANPLNLGLGSATIMRWNALSGNYEPITTLRIGEGYFVRVPSATRLDLAGEPINDPVSIELQPGWNLIANPYLLPLVWSLDRIQVRRNGTTLSLRDACQQGWLEDYLWTWRQDPNDPLRGQYQLVYDASVLPGVSGTLEPWQAYWILAREACTLVFTPPSRARAPLPRPNGWSLRVQVVGAGGQSEAVLGVGRALLASQPPNAPEQELAPSVGFRRTEGVFTADMRERTTRALQWNLEVRVPPSTSAQNVAMVIWGTTQLPHGVQLALVDEQTGKRMPLRGRAHYLFAAPAEGGVYRFRIEPISIRSFLRVLNPTVQGGRGHGSQYQIQFTLTGSASVQVQIRSGGQVVRILESAANRSAGLHQVIWDGRDSAGRMLPPGQYLVEITAISEEGQVARAVLPLVNTR